MTKHAQLILALLVTSGFFFCVYRLQTMEIPSANRDLLNIMLGVLGTVWVKCIGYFFDSSVSSKMKDEILGNMAQASPVSINTTEKVSGNINIESKSVNDKITETKG